MYFKMSFDGLAACRPGDAAGSPERIDRAGMARKSTHRRRAKRGKKDIWQLYNLQSLVPAQFIHIVNGILMGRYGLVGNPRQRESGGTDKK